MKLKKLKIIMIVMLLICSNSLLAINNDSVPLRGSEYEDTTLVLVPIENIKSANIKLIERKYLIQEVEAKDSIIDLKNNFIDLQNSEIEYYKNYIGEVQDINKGLNKKVKKYKNGITIGSTVTITVAGVAILYLLLK